MYNLLCLKRMIHLYMFGIYLSKIRFKFAVILSLYIYLFKTSFLLYFTFMFWSLMTLCRRYVVIQNSEHQKVDIRKVERKTVFRFSRYDI